MLLIIVADKAYGNSSVSRLDVCIAVHTNTCMHEQKWAVSGNKCLIIYTCGNFNIHDVIFAKLHFAFIHKRNSLKEKEFSCFSLPQVVACAYCMNAL